MTLASVRVLLSVIFGWLALPAQAEMHALSQEELRQAVSDERMLSGQEIIAHLPQADRDAVLDLQAFALEDQLVYRIVYRSKDGVIRRAMLNAVTGRKISSQSPLGQAASRCEK